jgi:uncharacterized protein YhhL (DUF1145 family)
MVQQGTLVVAVVVLFIQVPRLHHQMLLMVEVEVLVKTLLDHILIQLNILKTTLEVVVDNTLVEQVELLLFGILPK